MYETIRAVEDDEQLNGVRLAARVRPTRRGHRICSGRGQRGAGYDRLGHRRFECLPRWGIVLTLGYAMRRTLGTSFSRAVTKVTRFHGGVVRRRMS